MEIEKNVPIPSRGSILKTSKYDFLKRMEVGDSVLITDENLRRTMDHHARVYAERMGIRVTTRRVPEGLRLWRIG